ncbi:MAG TPA: nicotinate phosphoribosyltransferase [Acidimicrobiia bacterium]|nr:nicotinate phosphoribosyltransferase [Acidimicrobiia bacterium]
MDRAVAEGILFTDQYQLSMAQLYFRKGLAERDARFEHFFRRYPDYGQHQAGYCINAGMAWFVQWMQEARFDEAALAHLAGHETDTGQRIFEDDFLGWLADVGDLSSLRIESIPEGRVVHPNVPITVVEGPLALAQIVETPLLNHLNFQTLIATKASRVVEAARGGSVLEFGMRRGPERGATAASRASLVGGVGFSSNAGMSHEVGIAPKGTHAHSMVQVFMALGEGELGAFRAYAEVYPDDCLLLVDTIDTLESGVPNAIKVFEELRAQGHQPAGIRLDSGDLAHLSVQSARLLDEAGFPDVTIVLSSGLDEITIWQILNQIGEEAPRYGVDPASVIRRLVYGVGTKLATSEGDPSLDGVYKLVAIDGEDQWRPAIKLSDTPGKVVNPGRKAVHRVYDERGFATADVIAQANEELTPPLRLYHPTEPGVERRLISASDSESLLEKVDAWSPVDELGAVEAARERRLADLERLDPGVRRLVNPHVYHVSLSEASHDLKQSVIAEMQSNL